MQQDLAKQDQIEAVLCEIGKAAVTNKPARIRLSMDDLSRIPWLREELEQQENQEEITDTQSESAQIMIRELDESLKVSQIEVQNSEWIRNLIRKALVTKPVGATHITFYTSGLLHK